MCITTKGRVLLLLVILICCLSACESNNSTNRTDNVMQREDPHIISVKEGSPAAYPDKTYGEAFDAFFGSPSWKYFKAQDDDSDEPCDVVEFVGYCTYQDVEVEACLQFTLDVDNGAFETTYLSFNDVPQSMLMLAALIEAAFTNEDLDTAASLPSEPSNPESAADASDPIDIEQSYAPILEKYAAAMTLGYDRSQLQDAGLNLLCAFHQDLSEIGYTYLDVDGDGREELLIGEYPAGQIFDLYTLVDGEPRLVFQSDERTIYTICTNGTVACSGSNSAFSHSDCYYTIDQNGELCLSEAIIIDTEISEDMCFYSTISESPEDAELITFALADQIQGQYVDQRISFLLMSTLNEQTNTSESDSLPTIPVDTSFPYGYYEKDGGGALDIGFSTDESQLLWFNFFKDRDESMYGGSWQEPDCSVNFDWFDLGEYSSYNLTIDGIPVDVFIDSTAITVTAHGPLDNMSADQISGTYYCKAQAINPW